MENGQPNLGKIIPVANSAGWFIQSALFSTPLTATPLLAPFTNFDSETYTPMPLLAPITNLDSETYTPTPTGVKLLTWPLKF